MAQFCFFGVLKKRSGITLDFRTKHEHTQIIGDLKILKAKMSTVFQEVITVSALMSFAAAVALWGEGIVHIFIVH